MDKNNNNEKLTKVGINWYPGHMAKTKREIIEKLNLIDVVYEVIDARMPMSSKIVDIDQLIKNKPRILILTKYDLCDKEITDKFIKNYQRQGYYVVATNLLTGQNVSQILTISKNLIQDENVKRVKKGLKPRVSIRALIVGVPNVGKSTLINRLVGKKATSVGDRPGVTKSLGWIRINKEIELLDSPGILWPKMDNQESAFILASLSSIKEEIVDSQELSAFILRKMTELYPLKLKERYALDDLDLDFIELCNKVAERRGAFVKGGEIDYEKVYSIIIKDLKEGRFGPVTLDRIDEK